jgi:tetratricopeptide (TPR) repeat protein
MTSPRRLTSSLIGLALVAAIAIGYAQWVSKSRVARARGASSASVAPSALGSAAGRDTCAKAADRCACSADQAAQLLAACFTERALQVVSRAPASCVSPAFLGVRAEALAALERNEDATKAATLALKADAQSRFARRALAIVAISTRDFATSDAALSQLSTEDPKDADSLFYLALSQRRRDHYNGAREGFLHVLRLNAQHIDARYNLVTLTAAAGAAQEAEHDYQELLQIAPVGDPRLISARTALHKTDDQAPAELPVLHQTGPIPSVVPSR